MAVGCPGTWPRDQAAKVQRKEMHFLTAAQVEALRHTAASLMIRQGTSVKAIQKQLGHATASITLDTYGHLFPDELDALADRLEDARPDALATLARTQRGPQVVPLEKPQVSGLVGGVGGPTETVRLPRFTTSLAV